ncbi:MAG: hypothetical protein COY49_10890, partial [Comamonadaceae bacterium CG_4_10_14_0_8_um_filter_57_29]
MWSAGAWSVASLPGTLSPMKLRLVLLKLLSLMLRWMFPAALVGLLAATQAFAGVMTRAELAQRFPAPYIIGEKDPAMPVWPIFEPNFQQKDSANELVGYVFESIDLAPVPGFSGVPVNLLIAIDHRGNYL